MRKGEFAMDKVLVVDDVEMNRDMLKDMLEDEYEVELAENGMRAIGILKERRKEFAAVLLDLVMPELDGFAVLQIMSNQKWLDKLPVIVISGAKSNDAEKKSLILGASDFIRKPFDNFLLKHRVKSMADLFSYKRSLEKKVEEQTQTVLNQNKLLGASDKEIKGKQQ